MKSQTLTVEKLFEKQEKGLKLKKTRAAEGLCNKILVPAVHRPGLSLTGYGLLKEDRRLLLLGRIELDFLKNLDPKVRINRLKGVVTEKNPLVIVTRGLTPPKELVDICRMLKIPILQSGLKSVEVLTKLTMILSEIFSPIESVHGTLIEAFGIGVLLQGDSSVGKSEAALGLIERGHRLISDDVVRIKRKDENTLIGKGSELNRHLLEIRGIGVVNVAHLFGAVCVNTHVQLDIIIHLEEWNDAHFYDRIGLEEKFTKIFDVSIPTYIIPVKPGRDIILLLEATILNHRLKKMGYHSAKEFHLKLLEQIANRKKVEKIGD